jgi:hypothetical protein
MSRANLKAWLSRQFYCCINKILILPATAKSVTWICKRYAETKKPYRE